MHNLIKSFGLDRLAIGGNQDNLARLDDLPVALYATDLEGNIIYCNRASILLWGKAPIRGKDKWCAHYDLYTTDGQFIPRDHCAMAMAVKQQKTLRGVEAIAVRPNGSAFRFLPFPTPLHNEDGELIGAVNMVIHLGEVELTIPHVEIDFEAAL